MRQILSSVWPARRQPSGRGRLVRWTIPVTEQSAHEDEARCARFEFAAGAEKFVHCKLDRAELRRSRERLLAASIGAL
jgi:hypothetical protein